MKTNRSSDIMGEAEKLFQQPSAPSNELDWSSPVPDESLAHLSVFQQIRETLSRYGAQPLVDRFIAKLAVHEGGCWVWVGSLDSSGYGSFHAEGLNTPLAHRIAYLWANGEVPALLDHIVCDTPRCVNPAHLCASDSRTNTLRGTGRTAINARKTHCIHGHEFGDKDWRTVKGKRTRRCRLCHCKANTRKK